MSIDDLNFLAGQMSANSVSIGDWETLIHYARGASRVVELGTNIGTTALILSYCAKAVITVDVFENLELIDNEVQREMYKNHWQSNKHTFDSIKKKLAFRDNILIEQRLSYSTADLVFDETIDFIFIDADHSYDGVKRDFFWWFNKIKTGGYFAFHDVGPGCPVFVFYNNELLLDERIELMPDVAIGPCWTKVFRKK